jgi:FAD/FMN-containing dehydrogenase
VNAASARADYEARAARTAERMREASGRLRSRTSSASNLYRYGAARAPRGSTIDLRRFNHVIDLDAQAAVLEVEGATTYETVVGATLPLSFLPTVTPELKHITVAGALVGIGIESTGFRHGFVHDGLIEADVLLPGGEVVRCTQENAFADLCRALPNSYGTLGYVLRARLKLMPARPYVRLENAVFDNIADYLRAMAAASERDDLDFVEGLIFSKRELLLTIGTFAGAIPEGAFDIYGSDIYYKALRHARALALTTGDYIFRYDPDLFWNVPESAPYALFRRVAPRSLRSSKFYNRYIRWRRSVRRLAGLTVFSDEEEQVIQDWQLPWSQAEGFVDRVFDTLPLDGTPCVAVPIRPQSAPTLYPVVPGALYFNLGCYCYVRKPAAQRRYEYTRILDEACFASGGIKMLYSTSFLDPEQFDRIYGGTEYKALKAKYDPYGKLPTLYEKAAGGAGE